MAITDVSKFHGLSSPYYRVFKSIEGKRHQFYTFDKSQAEQKFTELQAKAKPVACLTDFFRHSTRPFLVNRKKKDNHIGPAFITIATESYGKHKDKHTVGLLVSANRQDVRKPYIKLFPLKYGIGHCLSNAVEFAIQAYLEVYPDSLTEFDITSIQTWAASEKIQDIVAKKIWQTVSRVDASSLRKWMNRDNPMWLSLSTNEKNLLYVRFPEGGSLSRVVKGTHHLTHLVASFTAGLLRQLESGRSEQELIIYEGVIYFTLVTTWMPSIALRTGVDDVFQPVTPAYFNELVTRYRANIEMEVIRET